MRNQTIVLCNGCISLLQISELPTLREASYIPNPFPNRRKELEVLSHILLGEG